MRLLLDTHILLWWLADDPALTAQTDALLADLDNEIFASAISLWRSPSSPASARSWRTRPKYTRQVWQAASQPQTASQPRPPAVAPTGDRTPTPSSPGHRLGCAKLGYTLPVPAGWIIKNPCSLSASASDPGPGQLQIVVIVEHHGWWSAARSRASITADFHTGCTVISPLRWSTYTQGSIVFTDASAQVRVVKTRAQQLMAEAESFANGRLYKVVRSFVWDRSRTVNGHRAATLSAIFGELVIGSRPDTAAGPPARRS